MADPVTLPSIYTNFKAPAGTNPQDAQSAADQMAITYQPQESSITSTINKLNGVLQSDTQAQQQFGQVADQKISEIGNTLAGQLQGNAGAIGDIYKQGTAKVGSAYDEAGQTLDQAGQSITGGLKSFAESIGQGQALSGDRYGNDPMGRLQGNLALLKGMNATSKASSVSNLTTLGTQLQSIAQKAVGDSQANYAQKRSDIATQVLKTVGQLQVQTNEKVGDLLQQFSDLAAQEGPAFRQILDKLTSARTAAESKAALDSINTQLKVAKLQIEQDKATTAADPNSLDNQLKVASLTGKNYTNSLNANKPTSIDDAAGNNNLISLLNSLRNDPDPNAKLSGTSAAGIANFINQNASTAGALGGGQTPYQYLVNLAQSQASQNGGIVKLPKTAGSKYSDKDYAAPLGVVLAALAARYTNVGSPLRAGMPVK